MPKWHAIYFIQVLSSSLLYHDITAYHVHILKAVQQHDL